MIEDRRLCKGEWGSSPVCGMVMGHRLCEEGGGVSSPVLVEWWSVITCVSSRVVECQHMC